MDKEQVDVVKKDLLIPYTEWPKKLAHFFARHNFKRLNFIKCWPIFKLIILFESGEHL